MSNFFPRNEQNLYGVLRYFYLFRKSSYYSYINVSASGCNTGCTYLSKYVIDFSSNNWWFHENENSFIEFCFLKHKIKLIGYDVQTSNGGCKMKDWIIIGSNKANSFPENAENSKRTTYQLRDFGVANVDLEFQTAYQCFKLKHFGSPCTNGKHGFDVYKIDFYGYLYPLNYVKKTCNKNLNNRNYFIFISILVFI